MPPPPLDKSAPESFPATIGTLGDVHVWRSPPLPVTTCGKAAFGIQCCKYDKVNQIIFENVLILEITPSSNTNVMCLQINLIAIMSL